METSLLPNPNFTYCSCTYQPLFHSRKNLNLNLKHLSFLKCTRALTSAVAADPLSIAQGLLERGIVSEQQVRAAQLQTKDNYLKASELVIHLTEIVGNFPGKYEEVLDVLKGFPWLKDGVKKVENMHKAESRRPQAHSKVCVSRAQYIRLLARSHCRWDWSSCKRGTGS